jgi:hypothetical protein
MILPITRLNFGRTHLSGSYGKFEVGPLECSGSRASSENEYGEMIITLIPTNCSDLFQIGHTLTGFYSVLVEEYDEVKSEIKSETNNKHKLIKTIFCDFSQASVNERDAQYFNSITQLKLLEQVSQDFAVLNETLMRLLNVKHIILFTSLYRFIIQFLKFKVLLVVYRKLLLK